jgi:hypothetical protein
MIWTELGEPKPDHDQVAIAVAPSGLNFFARSKNSRFSIGERVCATVSAGRFAQVAVADRMEAARIPTESRNGKGSESGDDLMVDGD